MRLMGEGRMCARRSGGQLLVWDIQGFLAGDRNESQTKGEKL